MFKLIQVEPYHVVDEEPKIDECVADHDEGAEEEEQNEVHELVSTTHSEGSGVNPHHSQLMENHLNIYKWPHYNFRGEE
jgi:hypothetical protein